MINYLAKKLDSFYYPYTPKNQPNNTPLEVENSCFCADDDQSKKFVAHKNGGERHPIHLDCLKLWVKNLGGNSDINCPICKQGCSRSEYSKLLWLTSVPKIRTVAGVVLAAMYLGYQIPDSISVFPITALNAVDGILPLSVTLPTCAALLVKGKLDQELNAVLWSANLGYLSGKIANFLWDLPEKISSMDKEQALKITNYANCFFSAVGGCMGALFSHNMSILPLMLSNTNQHYLSIFNVAAMLIEESFNQVLDKDFLEPTTRLLISSVNTGCLFYRLSNYVCGKIFHKNLQN